MSSVSDAMDQVLRAERDAQSAVAQCEHACAEILERARQQRRSILERAQTRIVALHTGAAKRLELQAAAVTAQRRKSAVATAAQLSDPERRSAALERLAARLTKTETARPRDDD